ncbi:hypothetical protein TRL7639_01510 [Falsiruegeria litorea R37]|uniref:D-galactarate dehydratase n=1 Tax=Falsiruegeria litorea R37 TaxID=1200284 RepID=A0A1Y5S7R2_9RHOB|nr:hypothetical protein [Falsiruegeria litorea]SLN33783.1 hypothetical protein TRL7639_01510 [Falsiruegeria litorea R37]
MKYMLLIAVVAVAGCDQVRSTSDRVGGWFSSNPEPAENTVEEVEVAEVAETPEEEVAEASQTSQAQKLETWTGAKQTIAGLGDPTKGGIWMETPLVQVERTGRVVVRQTGASATVTLIPIPGDPTAGSFLSLEAMRKLLAPLEQLVELDVYSS